MNTAAIPGPASAPPDSGRRLRLHGAVGLALGVLCSALGTALMRHSSFGLSSFYAVSLALYHASGLLSMGVWNTVYQIALILFLMLFLRRARWGYLASFGVVVVSSALIDWFSAAVARWPDLLPVRLGCYLAGLLILSAGISLLANCKLPVMPINLFVREIAEAKGWPFGRFKLCFDLACLTFSVTVGLIFVGSTPGVGWGTLVSVLCVGPLADVFLKLQNRLLVFYVP